MHSIAFNDMFSLAEYHKKMDPGIGLGCATDGLTEQYPMILHEVVEQEFTYLLRALYNS